MERKPMSARVGQAVLLYQDLQRAERRVERKTEELKKWLGVLTMKEVKEYANQTGN